MFSMIQLMLSCVTFKLKFNNFMNIFNNLQIEENTDILAGKNTYRYCRGIYNQRKGMYTYNVFKCKFAIMWVCVFSISHCNKQICKDACIKFIKKALTK